jgi:2-amino-4-hydroxy-6-hydroxymethyldihydropteridine diphosphokinase
MTMARAGIALGSNLGDRLANLRAALLALREISAPGEPVLAAPVYQTEPCDCPPGSPDFLNTVVEIAFDGQPAELLTKTRYIERQLGRAPAAERNAPRVIDLDLLYLGDVVHESADLVLPHPRIVQRRFVLQPLAEIRPELKLPGQDVTIAGLLERLNADESPLSLVSGTADADRWP